MDDRIIENAHELNANLSLRQISLLIFLGALFWFMAALLMRAIVPLPFYDGWGVATVYVLTIPATLPFVFIVSKISALHRSQIAIGYTIATTAALLLDGCAFAVIPWLYADNSTDALQAAAAILWGAGVGQMLAFINSRR